MGRIKLPVTVIHEPPPRPSPRIWTELRLTLKKAGITGSTKMSVWIRIRLTWIKLKWEWPDRWRSARLLTWTWCLARWARQTRRTRRTRPSNTCWTWTWTGRPAERFVKRPFLSLSLKALIIIHCDSLKTHITWFDLDFVRKKRSFLNSFSIFRGAIFFASAASEAALPKKNYQSFSIKSSHTAITNYPL